MHRHEHFVGLYNIYLHVKGLIVKKCCFSVATTWHGWFVKYVDTEHCLMV